MFVTRKTINVNSEAYKQAKTAFKEFQQKRNDLMNAIRAGNVQEANGLYNEYKQGIENLGLKVCAYHNHLETKENGAEIERKGSYAGMARLSAAEVTIEEMKAVSEHMSEGFKNALEGKEAKVKSVTFAALYEEVMRDKNENVEGKRHKTAAKVAGKVIQESGKKNSRRMS